MNLQIKSFAQLNLEELYQLLQLRSEVFVVEQNCVYQDIDAKDDQALHVLGKENGEIIAYARLFPPGKYFKEAAIGRVVVKRNYRERKLGHALLKASISGIKEFYGTGEIKISAQTYLRGFYEQHGFKAVGEPYLEDGIPHIGMCRSKSN